MFVVSKHISVRILNVLIYSHDFCYSKICLNRIITDNWENKFNIQIDSHYSTGDLERV